MMNTRETFSENKIFHTITFYWYIGGNKLVCSVHNKTYEQGLEVAKYFGYKEPKWFSPMTWNNAVVTVYEL